MKKRAHKNSQQPKNLTPTETSVGSPVLQNGWLGNVAASFSLWKVASDSNGEPLQWGQYSTQNPVWNKIIIQKTFGGTLARNQWCFNCYILINFMPNKTWLVSLWYPSLSINLCSKQFIKTCIFWWVASIYNFFFLLLLLWSLCIFDGRPHHQPWRVWSNHNGGNRRATYVMTHNSPSLRQKAECPCNPKCVDIKGSYCRY